MDVVVVVVFFILALFAPAYFTHTHRGQVPVSNDKYILTSWVLFNRAEQIYGPSAN